MTDFYSKNYRDMFYSRGIATWATTLIHKALEKRFSQNSGMRLLEVGGGEGFHVPYVKADYIHYTLLDLEKRTLDAISRDLEEKGKLSQVIADASNLPFPDNSFDRVIFMCVLHHLRDIEPALLEARRCLKDYGWISIYLPCDPGLIYRVTRKIFTFRKSRQIGVNYEVTNAYEHRNHISSLLLILKTTFFKDKVQLLWRPLPLGMWNLNLYCIVSIQKNGGDSATHQS